MSERAVMPATVHRYGSLDLLRGVASLLVMSGHLRAYIFLSRSALEQAGVHLGLAGSAFYAMTSLGHQAVMVFFALSGFLVGGKALGDLLAERFTWQHYLLRRLTRLWLVIVPALLLTLLFDRMGMQVAGDAGYDGRYYSLYCSGPKAASGIDLTLASFLGNLAFLQSIYVPIFGSNGPMWSLANEFWYYIIFPLMAWLCLATTQLWQRLAGAAILAGLLIAIPVSTLAGGAIWVAGAAAAWAASLFRWDDPVAVIAAAALAMLLLAATLVWMPAYSDFGIGFAVALVLPGLAHLPSRGGVLSLVGRASSEISYTLYLTHFPLLTVIVMTLLAPGKWPPGLAGAGLYAGLFVLAIAWAGVVWWCFERNTDRLHRWLVARVFARTVADVRPDLAP